MKINPPQDLLANLQNDWACQDYGRALSRVEDYWNLSPQDAQRCLLYATVLGHCSRFHEAKTRLDEMVQTVPRAQRLWALGSAGVACSDFLRFDWTADYMQLAAAENNPPVAVFQYWAEALERLNRMPEAAAVLAWGESHFPDHPGLILLEARLARRNGYGEQAEHLARRIIGMTHATADIQCQAQYELGNALDMQDRCGEAYAAFVAAKEMQRSQAAALEHMWRSRIRQMQTPENLPSAEDFGQWAELSSQIAKRHAFIVGCPRSGTTLLERMLGSHPQMVSSSESTIWHSQVWMPLLRAHVGVSGMHALLAGLTAEEIKNARQRYWRYIVQTVQGELGERWLLDKNPSIFPSLAGAVRLFPEARLLTTLRDPRDIVWSCFTQSLPVNPATAAFISLESTAEQVAAELEQWLALRERLATSWLEVRYEDLVREPEQQMRRVLSFLDLAWSPQVLEFHQRRDPVRSPTYADATRPVHQEAIGRWRRYAEWIQPLETKLGKVLDMPG